jgi:hypothetical protein
VRFGVVRRVRVVLGGDGFQVLMKLRSWISPPPAWLGWNAPLDRDYSVTCRSPPAASLSSRHSRLLAASVHRLRLIGSHQVVHMLGCGLDLHGCDVGSVLDTHSSSSRRFYFWSISKHCIMAASLATVKKELRQKIKIILKELPEAAAASQCMCSVES